MFTNFIFVYFDLMVAFLLPKAIFICLNIAVDIMLSVFVLLFCI